MIRNSLNGRCANSAEEAGGILFGTWSEKSITIKAVRAFECEHKFGPAFLLSHKDEAALLRELVIAREDAQLRALQPIGLYVAHSPDLSFAVADIRIFRPYLSKTRHIGLILRLLKKEEILADFFSRERSSVTYFCAQEESSPVSGSSHRRRRRRRRLAALTQQNEKLLTNEAAAPKEIGASTVSPLNPASPAGCDERTTEPNLFALKRWELVAATVLLLLCAAATRGLWVRSKPIRATTVPIEITRSNPATALPEVPIAQSLPKTSKEELPVVADISAAVTVREKENNILVDRRRRRTNEGRSITRTTQAVNGNRELRVFHLPLLHNSASKESRIQADLPDAPDISIGQSVAPAVLVSGVALARPAMQARPIWGRLIWTGDLQRNGFIVFSASGSSRGVLNGRLPGVPIKTKVQPGEVIEGGIAILTNDVNRVGFNEPSYARNGWDLVIYKWVPKPVPELRVVEPPGPSNNWSRMVLQNGERNLSVVIVDWEASGASKPGN